MKKSKDKTPKPRNPVVAYAGPLGSRRHTDKKKLLARKKKHKSKEIRDD